ncbi:hypothetical protein [Aquibacillus kalidii]|nr:hypothetical protein [Aquibacillus kalidii]
MRQSIGMRRTEEQMLHPPGQMRRTEQGMRPPTQQMRRIGE